MKKQVWAKWLMLYMLYNYSQDQWCAQWLNDIDVYFYLAGERGESYSGLPIQSLIEDAKGMWRWSKTLHEPAFYEMEKWKSMVEDKIAELRKEIS